MVEGGFTLTTPGEEAVVEIRWASVTRIHTYKLDLYTTDCICLVFELDDGREPLQIHEELEGFREIFGPLERAFPSLPADWYLTAMANAFEANYRVLYERAPRA
jgi:hypothetical protein